MVTIITVPHEVLRGQALLVSKEDFGSKRLTQIIADMKTALSREEQGVAIAAPQIGVPLCIFVVAGHVFAIQKEEDPAEKKYADKVYINPRIISRSKKTALMHEGCLSVRGKNKDHMMWGRVPRSEKVKIEACDETGKKMLVGASGLLAQIFQHEIDHLEGVLYTDKAKELYEEKPST